MTLHWWMHWFWVTLLIISDVSGRASAAPQSEELQHITTEEEIQHRQPERQSRAMYFTKAPATAPPIARIPNNSSVNQTSKDTIGNETKSSDNATMEIIHPSIQWVAANVTESTSTTMPTTIAAVANTTTLSNNHTELRNTTSTKKRNLTKPGLVKGDTQIEGVSESRIVTEKPLSLETSYLQTKIPPNVESSKRVNEPSEGEMDMGAIAGISFAALVLAALAGSTAFVLYRRRYLNKPQTLNDKCSNPDSSGYLDDSTIRDNSEEMYSLDNDSFLNSLEAMTIQNYWTDTVKHTKLSQVNIG
ncbi:hypothetical protein ACJJTC_016730 [Scirpophaga incertulas]